jgi:2-aminoadipate transaminase
MVDIQFSTLADRLRRSEIRELLKLTRKHDIISFAGGLPDPSLFPLEAVRRATEAAIDERGNLALQYSPTEGDPFLKEQIISFMNRQGENVDPENMLIVASSQQGLDLIAKIFIDPGDPIIVEMPTYLGAIQAFRTFNADFCGVEMDYDGVIIDKLEARVKTLIGAGRKPKFVYLIPDFQNPSGITLSLEGRKQVLGLASKYDLFVIEDSPYREIKFEGDLIPSLYSLDTEGRVMYLKTFSKIFCPGFRLGWIVGPKPVIDKLVIAKQSADLCTSAFVSIVAAYIIKNGYLESQIEKSKKLYAVKTKVMLDALEKYMPDIEGLSWSKPEGGMFLWLKLPDYMDTVEMFMDAVKLNIAYVIGSAFHHDGSGRNTMRINYSYPSEKQIITGIRRLATVVKKRQIMQSAIA